jgi:hypothetical protein
MMSYAVLLGADKIIGTHGVLAVEQDGKTLEFFRVRSIFRPQEEGSALSFDLNVKDTDGERDIKLANGNPVVMGMGIKVDRQPRQTLVTRADGSLIVKIEQLEPDAYFRPTGGPLQAFFAEHPVEAVIRITGDFYAGTHRVQAALGASPAGGDMLHGAIVAVTPGDLRLTPFGFSA